MTRLRQFLGNPPLWGALIFLAGALMVWGWDRTYPLDTSQGAQPLSPASAPFWGGLFAGAVGLAGLMLTSKSRYVHLVCAAVFVLMLTAPQFLYRSWGSDAGMLGSIVKYARGLGSFEYQRDVKATPYFQWPLSVFLHQFLADLLLVDSYEAVQIGFAITAVAVAGSLFALWSPAERSATASAAFWGLVCHFGGFSWLLNWQAVPYTVFLALFLPLLAILEGPTLSHKVLLLLFVTAGLEAHALFGVWAFLVVLLLVTVVLAWRKGDASPTLVVLLLVAQTALIVFKNFRFMDYLVLNLTGSLDALRDIQATDATLRRNVVGALVTYPADSLGIVMKVLSWLDLALFAAVISLSTVGSLRRRLVTRREAVLLVASSAYATVGLIYAAVGIRAIHLLALVPPFSVVRSLQRHTAVSRLALLLCLLGLLIFPAALARSHQNPPMNVNPSDLLLAATLSQSGGRILAPGATMMGKHNHGLSLSESSQYYSFRQLRNRITLPEWRGTLEAACQGPILLVDSTQSRQEMRQLLGPDTAELLADLGQNGALYDSGPIAVRYLQDCDQFGLRLD